MKCLIIDDEPISREIIEDYVSRIDFLELIASCEDVFEAMEYIEKDTVGLLLSDIQMPKVNGIEFIKSIANPPLIIFITAYDSFAIEGYDIGVVDYLLKPVPFERFLKAVNKARSLFILQKPREVKNDNNGSNYIFLKIDNKLTKVLHDQILYIESTKDYQKIFLSGGKFLLVYSTLKSMEERLSRSGFFRIHHSFLVNTRHIKSIQGNVVELSNDKSLPIAISKKDELYKILQIGK